MSDPANNANIIKGGWFAFSFEDESHTAVLKTPQDLESYIQTIVAEFRKDTAIVSDGFWEQQEAHVREFYAKFNEEFFKTSILVIALIDRGSGSASYQLVNSSVTGRTFTVDIERGGGLIMTMDYVSWVLMMELCREVYEDIGEVNVNLHIKT